MGISEHLDQSCYSGVLGWRVHVPAKRKSDTASSGNSARKEHRNGGPWEGPEDGRKLLFSFKAESSGLGLYADQNIAGEAGRSFMIQSGAIPKDSSVKVGAGAQN